MRLLNTDEGVAMRITKKAEREKARNEAIKRLRVMLHPGNTVYTILRHVSRSGQQREISVLIGGPNGIDDFSWTVAMAIENKIGKTGGIVMGGWGMDMGFALVYELSRVLFPEGFDCIEDKEIGKRCPANDHFNRFETKHHSDGGYALIHRWL
jgi:hypothetical protein